MMAWAICGWQCRASPVTVQPFRTRLCRRSSVALISLPPGARAWAMASRVWVSQTLTISGGIKAQPFLVAAAQALAIHGDDAAGRAQAPFRAQRRHEGIEGLGRG